MNRSDVRIFAYNPHSESAKNLSDALGVRRLKHQGKPAFLCNKTIINYGSSKDKYLAQRQVSGEPNRVINKPELCSIWGDKLQSFENWNRYHISSYYFLPPWTTDPEVAAEWMYKKDCKVVARKSLTGHSGHGIIICDDELVEAPLYVQYIPKKEEYRVHLAFGNIIDVQRKVKSSTHVGPIDWHVRNHAGGFIYQRNDINPNESVLKAAKIAFQLTGLDFGAVDVIWNEKRAVAYVLEINTAPGITGTTIEKYKEAFTKELQL